MKHNSQLGHRLRLKETLFAHNKFEIQRVSSCVHAAPQDTNILEYEILKLLKGSGASLFVVGDPNQAIYRWRGAITENLNARFNADFQHCTSFHHLEHNHRLGGLFSPLKRISCGATVPG